ncbi:uncharacterized protein LOC111110971 isoform X2 [Crassostrea virginica]
MSIILICLLLYCFLYTVSGSDENLKCKSETCCEQWNEADKRCAVCSPGYLGWNCSEKCPYPNYGRECQDECKCEERLCDFATGCYPLNVSAQVTEQHTQHKLQTQVTVSSVCSPGYLGWNCSEICRYPNYGRECQDECKCEERLCDFTTGCYPLNVSTQVNEQQRLQTQVTISSVSTKVTEQQKSQTQVFISSVSTKVTEQQKSQTQVTISSGGISSQVLDPPTWLMLFWIIISYHPNYDLL